jgi:hypothetical protein
MNDVTLFSGALPVAAVTGALRKLAMTRTQGAGKAFMKFTKQGEFVFGAENTEAKPTEEWAANPASFQIGVIGWRGGSVVGEVMFPITSPERVDYDSLEPINTGKDGDGWSEQYTVDLKNMKTGDEVIFKTTSKGGKNAIGDLAAAVAVQIEKDATLPVPVLHLTSDFYKHKQYGKVFTPIFEIIGWVDANGKKPEKRRALV